MANFNKVILAGNLTRDPQLRYLPSQTAVADFGLAVNRKWKDQSGQSREDVCFIDCNVFGKSAEILCQYMSKGKQLLVEGRLQFDQWEGKDGVKRSKHRVFVESFQFLGQPTGALRPAPQAPQAQHSQQAHQAAPAQQAPPDDFNEMPPEPPPSGDNIPF